jgi:phosphatidylglycerol lysyltransferase
MSRASLRRWGTPLVAAIVLSVALYLLHRELRGFTFPQILQEARTLPNDRILAAVGFTLLSYFALTGYDWLGVRHARLQVPYRRVAFASFLGYAFSQALGFPLITGIPPRYRLYSSWGVEAPDIARIIAFYSSTFWLGLLALGGVSFLVEGPALPASLHALGATARPLGAAFTALALGYLVWCRFGRGAIRVGRWSLGVPSLGTGVRQIIIASADWIFAAAVLYALLPTGLGIGFGAFLGTFLLAQIVGFISHVPGGLGVFEVVLLVSLPNHPDGQALVASLLAYRAIYYLMPLVLAAAALGIYEFRQRREALDRALSILGSGMSSATPLVLSGLVFVAGGLLLATGAIPSGGRMAWLGDAPPLALLEASHFLSSLVGASLLILAWGLARRLDGAFHAALALLGVGAVLSAMRTGGLLPSLVLLLALMALAPTRKEFFRRSALLAEPLSQEWVFGVIAVLLATSWLGFFAYRDVAYSGDLWWRFALHGDAPRFLRGSVGAGAVLLVFAIAKLLRPAEPDEAATPEPAPEQVTEIVARSPRTHGHLAFLGDKSFLLSESGRAFLMFGVEGRSWVGMGDPVGDPEDYPELVWELRTRALRHGGWPVFYQVRPEFLPLYVDSGLTLIKLGEEAVVDTAAFTLQGSRRSGLRQTLRRVERAGGTFEVLPPEGTQEAVGRLREISDAWLQGKNTHEKSFSLGSFSEEYVSRFPVGVIKVDDRIVAFANVWLGAPGEEFSVDLMRYEPGTAPLDSMEYLFIQMILWGKEVGYARFSLGTAPLSGLEGGPLAPLWARLGATVFRYGEHFYNFQGLRAYKNKFDPNWEARYLASPGGLALPRVLGNIAALISGSLRGALAR